MTVEPLWDYWCPAEGTHMIHPQELQVGIVSVDDTGMGHALLIAAVVPPILRDHGWSQCEAFARTIRDALANGPWLDKDGFAAGLAAHGAFVPFPKVLPGGDNDGDVR